MLPGLARRSFRPRPWARRYSIGRGSVPGRLSQPAGGIDRGCQAAR
ncbi:hypothetical protein CSB93_2149 [Pseudomonas paraeruginosa]|uniref:Uncharacterized protein n=1 Tax=Pseudomonas paraeruginosa TaxID=2994495 RepID=A0A2R3IMJ3_9PSED|nr:hypothetical protein CSB93_2149 [Pseudomonas paraeruginosa]AWE91220.1 hypothetical protein CSC28_0916 [Pseudomonas paraeruginosa]